MRHTLYRLLPLLIVPALLALTGCFKGIDAASDSPLGPAWQPQPMQVRVLPSTRFVREADVPLLEARIELIDAMGDAVKASGTLRAELFTHASPSDDQGGARLYQWDLTLHTLADQQQFFDTISRGYLLRLKIDDPTVANRPTLLKIAFDPAHGDRLTTTASLGPSQR